MHSLQNAQLYPSNPLGRFPHGGKFARPQAESAAVAWLVPGRRRRLAGARPPSSPGLWAAWGPAIGAVPHGPSSMSRRATRSRAQRRPRARGRATARSSREAAGCRVAGAVAAVRLRRCAQATGTQPAEAAWRAVVLMAACGRPTPPPGLSRERQSAPCGRVAARGPPALSSGAASRGRACGVARPRCARLCREAEGQPCKRRWLP